MQTTNTIPSPALDPAKNNWNFLEVWVDPMQSPPYLLMLLVMNRVIVRFLTLPSSTN